MKLDPRLACVSSCVEKGSYIIDVGTDHAYVPIFLCKSGVIDKAVASDIREGPLKIAKENISKFGLSSKIDTLLCSGLEKAHLYPGINCVVIAGMGGDMIVSILKGNEELSKKAFLILQPMTHYVQLRKFLFENGYEIKKEKLAKDEHRVYQVICAKYTSNNTDYTEEELYLGKYLVANKEKNPLFEDHRNYILHKLNVIYNGSKDEHVGELIEKIKNK